MTSLAAVVGTESTADPEVLRAAVTRMQGSLAHRPTDRHRIVMAGHAGLAVRERWATPGAESVGQPLQRTAGLSTTWTMFAGRLDNVAELASQLGLAAATTDLVIAAEAHRRWGEGCVERFVGDFVLVVWDESARQLFAARDRLGQQPLYWAARDGLLFVATELAAVLAGIGTSPAVNEGFLAELLVFRPASVTETLWSGVERVPPAHVLVAGRGVRLRRYWDIEPAEELRLGGPQDYLERYRDVFTEAVRCRLRAVGPVACELSGGLDSSSVVGVAAQLFGPGGSLLAAVMDHTRGGPADEAAYWQLVLDKWQLDVVVQDGERVDPTLYSRLARRHRDYPETAESAGWFRLMERVEARGSRVVLNGQWGDEWSYGTPWHAAELLARGRRVAAWAEAGTSARWGSPPERVAVLAAQLSRAATAATWATGLRQVARRVRARGRGAAGDPASWQHLPPELRRRVGLAERLAARPVPSGFSPAKAFRYRSLHSGFATWLDELGQRSAADLGLVTRAPFTDVRLVELVFALPETWFRSDGWERVIQRRALAAVLPPKVAQRETKAHAAATFLTQIDALGGRDRLGGLTVADAGWLEPATLVAWYDAARDAGDEPRHVMQLWSALAIEEWWTNGRQDGRSTVSS